MYCYFNINLINSVAIIMIEQVKRTLDFKIYTEKERSDMAQTILCTYCPFVSKTDISHLLFSVACQQKSIGKIRSIFKNKIISYYLIVFDGKKKYKSKITFQEIELLKPVLIGYDLYVRSHKLD